MIFRRLEFKYFIDPARRDRLRARIAPYMIPDEHVVGGSGGYRIESLYLDDLSLTEFRLKVDGYLRRSKVRIRRYPGTTARYLERKDRTGSIVTKERVPIPESIVPVAGDWFTAAARAAVAPAVRPAWDDIATGVLLRRMRPVVGVRYVREVYVSRFGDPVRVNFDTDLEACAADFFSGRAAWRRAASPAHAILEIKTRTFIPGWLRGLVREGRLVPRAISKYAYAIVSTRRTGERPPT